MNSLLTIPKTVTRSEIISDLLAPIPSITRVPYEPNKENLSISLCDMQILTP